MINKRMSVVYGILLQAKGDIKKIKLKDAINKDPLTQDDLQKILKKKTPIKFIGFYEYDSMTVSLFGYTTGKTGTENKHELPPPHNTQALFSDSLIIASKGPSWTNPINFTTEQYEKFYQHAFGNEVEDDNNESSDDEDSDEEKEAEEEEDEEEEIISSKKKKAVEDGEPEDEGDDIEEEDEDDDEVEEEEEESEEEVEEVEGEGEVEEEEEVAVVKKKPASKKKSKASTSAAQNTLRAKQQILLIKPGFEEIQTKRPIPKEDCKERDIRLHVVQTIKKLIPSISNPKDQEKLEISILAAAMRDATDKSVLKHFDNELFMVCYNSAFRRFMSNLSKDSYVKNSQLLTKLENKDLTIENLADMTIQDFAPMIYVDLRERQLLREQQQLEGNKAMATDMFKCGRCHKRETTFYELQTRSADEPMTKFITCLNCGNHWRK
jgi:DNA-directed RNA polymerase subunit M/transcription elongation factor TFIIS